MYKVESNDVKQKIVLACDNHSKCSERLYRTNKSEKKHREIVY